MLVLSYVDLRIDFKENPCKVLVFKKGYTSLLYEFEYCEDTLTNYLWHDEIINSYVFFEDFWRLISGWEYIKINSFKGFNFESKSMLCSGVILGRE